MTPPASSHRPDVFLRLRIACIPHRANDNAKPQAVKHRLVSIVSLSEMTKVSASCTNPTPADSFSLKQREIPNVHESAGENGRTVVAIGFRYSSQFLRCYTCRPKFAERGSATNSYPAVCRPTEPCRHGRRREPLLRRSDWQFGDAIFKQCGTTGSVGNAVLRGHAPVYRKLLHSDDGCHADE